MVARMSGWFPLSSSATVRRVATGRLAMYIVEAGNGPPVLFIHGLGWDHSLWNPTVERLAVCYRAIAADTRGHGATDKPDGPYEIEMFAQDYAALIDALGLAQWLDGGARDLAVGKFRDSKLAMCLGRHLRQMRYA